MAQRVNIELVDDVDGSVAAETVQLGLDGVSYEIDLSDENATQLRDALAPWIGYARRVGGRRAIKSAKTDDNTAIRTWAKEQGMTVSERGRISEEIRQAYAKAH